MSFLVARKRSPEILTATRSSATDYDLRVRLVRSSNALASMVRHALILDVIP